MVPHLHSISGPYGTMNPGIKNVSICSQHENCQISLKIVSSRSQTCLFGLKLVSKKKILRHQRDDRNLITIADYMVSGD